MRTAGQITQQHLSMLGHCVAEVVTGEWTVSNDAAAIGNIFGQVGELQDSPPSGRCFRPEVVCSTPKSFPTPRPGT